MSGYLAVGDDGMRPVVWGIGKTHNEAIEDARRELSAAHDGHDDFDQRMERDVSSLTVHEVDDTALDLVRYGEIGETVLARIRVGWP